MIYFTIYISYKSRMDLSNENVIHIKKDGVEFLQFRKLLEFKDIINHAYSLGINANYRTARANKENLSEKEYEKAIKDYENLTKAIGSKIENLVKTNQAHTDEVKIVEGKINKNEPDIGVKEYIKTDGLITNKKNLLLSTTNADCILLLFFDPIKKVIANVHSGWRGTIQRISVKTVKKMVKEFASNPKDIICFICPSIRKWHFEVEKEVKEEFENEFKEYMGSKGKWLEETVKDKKWNIDTVWLNEKILQKEGLKKENIIDSKICSVCNSDQVHSFRVEGKEYGLSTALIELKDKTK